MEYTLTEVDRIAATLLDRFGRDRTYALVGELGAGKTTLISALCRRLGVGEPTSSPTFSIVNEYRSPGGPVFHLDCYRLESLEEALAAGLEDLFAPEEPTPVFVEWPEVIEPLLPENTVVVRLAHSAGGREISWTE